MVRGLFILACLSLAITGCEKHVDRDEGVFRSDDGEYVLTIALDMSGSFQEMMADNGRAWNFVCQVVDQYSRDRIGCNDKLILAQLSATDKAVLWRGTPLQLRQDFASGAEFRNWLASRADPSSSSIYEGIVQAVDYTLADPVMAGGKGKSAVFILSDMVDTSPDNKEGARRRAIDALAEVGKDRGVVGLYFVDVRLCLEWRRLLADAGVPDRHAHVEAEIVGRPLLPNFN